VHRASAEEIASVIVYLASDKSFIHGAVLAVDVGRAAP
jgi:NAD(P)-dependent dehydrogenase (short-subunit alcohol dehydrogenase family)